jgi:hypothetical protein
MSTAFRKKNISVLIANAITFVAAVYCIDTNKTSPLKPCTKMLVSSNIMERKLFTSFDTTSETMIQKYSSEVAAALKNSLVVVKNVTYKVLYDDNLMVLGLCNLNYIDQNDYVSIHRSGWQYVFEHLKKYNNEDKILLDLYLDKTSSSLPLNTFAFNSLVTRVSIWKSALELSIENLPFGVGASDGRPELVNYYKKTNQKFLAKYEFPTHNRTLSTSALQFTRLEVDL